PAPSAVRRRRAVRLELALWPAGAARIAAVGAAHANTFGPAQPACSAQGTDPSARSRTVGVGDRCGEPGKADPAIGVGPVYELPFPLGTATERYLALRGRPGRRGRP